MTDEAPSLVGFKAIVTAGPTQEPIDPVRYISNHSTGVQGFAIAEALSLFGAEVTLVTGPVLLHDIPVAIDIIPVTTAQQMHDTVMNLLPKIDIAICTAAVSDWRPKQVSLQKIKKKPRQRSLTLQLEKTPDILKIISTSKDYRPKLVVGFALETEELLGNASVKRKQKQCDWLLGNLLSDETALFGDEYSQIYFVTAYGHEEWPIMNKYDIGVTLAARIAEYFSITTEFDNTNIPS